MASVSEFHGPQLLFKPSHRLPLSYEAWGYALAISDACAIILTGCISVLTYAYFYSHAQIPVFSELSAPLGASFILGALYLASAQARGIYRPSSLLRNGTTLTKILTNWVGVFLFGSLAAFLLKIGDQFSRGALILYFATGAVALGVVRYSAGRLLTNALRHGGLKRKRIALIQDSDPHVPLSTTNGIIHSLSQHGYEIVRSYPANDLVDTLGRDSALARDDLLNLNRDGKLNEIVICAGAMNSKQLTNLMHQLRRIPVSVKLIPHSDLHSLLQRPLVDIGAGVAVELQRRPCSAFEQTIKRLIDVTLAGAGLLALCPMLLMIAALIRLDSPGPVFFAQRRTGFNGRVFRILKFRSMTTADDGNVIRQASRGDARITRIGGWLRSTSIDELPQLINVLRGEMSIVGPRPHAVAHDITYSNLLDNYALRYRMPPGITGWAQVTGYRGETATTELMAKRVEQDLWYIENWSLALDIKIIFRTIYSVMKIRDVY
jgi:Undecaprenyl-phosphate glucose phosphotransferase